MPTHHNHLDIVHNFKSNSDDTLNARDEYTTRVRRSYMYEFILIFIIAIIVLVITIRNMMSDTATTAGYVFCWIILIVFVIAVASYVIGLIGDAKLPSFLSFNHDNLGSGSGSSGSGSGSGSSGPVIRIHYV